MQRGELPPDAFDVLTRRDLVIETPLPPALEYFAGARYSALEVKGGDAWPDDDGADAWLSDLREDLIINANSDEWLRAFDSQALAAAISAARRSGHGEAPASSEEVVVAATPPPEAYVSCLRELRAAHDSGRMMRTMDPFWTSSGASRLDKAAAPRAGGATSALALAASAAKQATLNISTEKVAARLSGPPRAPQISLDLTLNVSQRAPRTQIASRVAYATTPVVVFYVS